MNKQQFLAAVAGRLSNLPQSDINKSLEYYSEMIDDRMEDGMSEEDAVGAMGTIDEVVSEILTPVQIAMMVGLILMFIGLAIFVLLLSNWAAKQGFRLSKRLIIKIKSNFVKRSVNK